MDLSGLTEKKNRAGTRYFVNEEGVLVAKECRECNNVKEITDFHRDKRGLGGARSNCKACANTYASNHYEKNIGYYRNYSKHHAEEISLNQKNWYRRKKECPQFRKRRRILGIKYKRDNPHIRRLHDSVRRARRRNLPGELTHEQRKSILDHFGGACALTGETGVNHLDHVIPLATGHGGTIYGNMIPLRADLNLSKFVRNIFDWFYEEKERFGLSQRKFDDLIEYLADINDMTVEEYEDYVRWCHDNPRSINEIETKKESKEPAS